MHPFEMVIYGNISAALFQQGRYEECIEWCERAIDASQQNFASKNKICKIYEKMHLAQKERIEKETVESQ